MEFSAPFSAPMAVIGVPSVNRVTLSPVGVWHLPHGGAPFLHRPDDEMFSTPVGEITALEILDEMWATGHALPSIAGVINDRSFRLSLEMVDMDMDMVNGNMFVRSGYVRAALLVRPSAYGWQV